MKVLDAKGAELRVGDRVERLFNVNGWVTGGRTGEIVGFDNSQRLEICVAFTRYRPAARFALKRKFSLRRTFTCKDLLLCTEKGGE